ncbi:malate:quinone oxidoreductase, partial [Staphylococcus epidermidis]|uniref:malate:quinone oxidoreductase n=1 Tax=Staphylococcus epidermidis TaxID=1282 RepID=UPI00164326B1
NPVLLGAGLLSTTSGSLTKDLDRHRKIKLYEGLDGGGIESCKERKNGGRGDGGLCELKYRVEEPDG